jgi:manganese efflux pump family protein
MGWLTLLTISVALAMDAFAVAVVTGLTLNLVTKRHLFRLSFHFGLFQAIMTAVGWAAGAFVQRYIASVDHWIAFALLALVGGNIIYGVLRGDKDTERTAPDLTSGRNLVMVSVATSIDALAVGLSLGVIGTTIAIPALVIGVTAALLTLVGMGLGRRIGTAWGGWVEVLGGVVLIAIGFRVVWQHVM